MGVFTNNRSSFGYEDDYNYEYTNESSHMGDYSYFDENEMDVVGESFQLLAESEQNYNAIMRATGIAEAQYYAETGQEYIYESSSTSGFFGKIKEFFSKLLEKIKEFFGKFGAMMSKHGKDDAAFVSKYKDKILKADMRDFKFSGFNYTIDRVQSFLSSDSNISNIRGTMHGSLAGEAIAIQTHLNGNSFSASEKNTLGGRQEALDSQYEDVSEMYEQTRGAILAGVGNNSGASTSAEFSKEIFETLRDGDSTKSELDRVSASDQLSIVASTKKVESTVSKAFKTAERCLINNIKTFDKIQKTLLKAAPDRNRADDGGVTAQQRDRGTSMAISLVGKYFAAEKQAQNDIQIMRAAYLNALKERNRQARAICVKIMTRKVKNESYSFYDEHTNESYGSHFDNIDFI